MENHYGGSNLGAQIVACFKAAAVVINCILYSDCCGCEWYSESAGECWECAAMRQRQKKGSQEQLRARRTRPSQATASPWDEQCHNG
jgi:hypothetical protein